MKIDLDRCYRGMENLDISGLPGQPERLKVIEEAVAAIQHDGTTALTGGYLGVKNYASFPDQRCDCEYGMGPRHGSIVFEVGRRRGEKAQVAKLGSDEIYLLEATRDAGHVYTLERNGYNANIQLNLPQTLAHLRDHQNRVDDLKASLEKVKVDTHA